MVRCLHFPMVLSVLALLLAAFAVALQVQSILAGNWAATGAVIYYGLVTALFLLRRPSQAFSTRGIHWWIALGGSWLPFLIEPVQYPSVLLLWLSVPIQVAGFVFVVIALCYLGNGFGVIAARREIKTRGVYRMIRHPLYAAELLVGLAIVIQSLSGYNVCLFVVLVGCQVMRIFEEEAILSQDERYRTYIRQVPFRLLPMVF